MLNKISQKSFAENLLSMKQANLSALLTTKAMPWECLSPMIKKRFLIMYLWLRDENRMEKLNNHNNNNNNSICNSGNSNIINSATGSLIYLKAIHIYSKKIIFIIIN